MIPAGMCVCCLEDKGGAAVCPHCGGPKVQNPIYLVPGTILKDQYLVGKVLGHGGFGITYLAWDVHLARKIAIKEYYPAGVGMRAGSAEMFPYDTARTEEYQFGLERFLDEARMVARFDNHPNIIWVQNFFTANGTAYIILEYLDGMTLEDYLRAFGGKLDWPTALRVMTPVMDALREIHKTNLLHRDIAPDNIYMLRNGLVKVIDFGAARYSMSAHSQNLSVVLKPGYAPPEQYQSRGNQGPWTDVYACAGTLYRAVTGVIPPTAPDRQAGELIVSPAELGASIPPAHERALGKAMALRVEDRWPSVDEFQRALQIEAPPTPAALPVPVPKPLPWAWLAAGGMGLVVFLLLAALLLMPKKKGPAIQSFRLEPSAVAAGESATLSWQVSEGAEAEIEGIGPQAALGSLLVKPSASTTYVLIAKANGAVVTKQVSLTVTQPLLTSAEILEFKLDPTEVEPNVPVTLSWDVAKATSVTIGNNEVKPSDTAKVHLAETGSWTLRATGQDGKVAEQTVTLTITPKTQESKVRVRRFEFNPATITVGESSNLYWDVPGATRLMVNGKQRDSTTGSISFKEAESFTVKLEADGPGGPVASSASLTVRPRSAPPAQAPIISRFDTTAVPPGEPGIILNWTIEGASYASINTVGALKYMSGNVKVTPRQSTEYVLTATSASGAVAVRRLTVRVAQPVRQSVSWELQHVHANLLRSRTCQGVLSIDGESIRWASRTAGDSFRVGLADIESVNTNKGTISGHGWFHVKIRNGSDYDFFTTGSVSAIVQAIQARTSGR